MATTPSSDFAVLVLTCSFVVGCEASNDPTAEHWQERIDAAFAPADCLEPLDLNPEYYTGRLVDSHLHIPALPDASPDEFDEGDYPGSDPTLGIDATITNTACVLLHERTDSAFSFFPVYQPIVDPSIEVTQRTMALYPDLFIPFLMPPGDPVGTVDVDEVEAMLDAAPGLFKGYGEIGMYSVGTETPDLPPDDRDKL